MAPEPSPPPFAVLTLICTTEGCTLAITDSRSASGFFVVDWEEEEPALLEFCELLVVVLPPEVHPVTNTAMSRSSGTKGISGLNDEEAELLCLNSGNGAEKDDGRQSRGCCRSGNCIGKISSPIIFW